VISGIEPGIRLLGLCVLMLARYFCVREPGFVGSNCAASRWGHGVLAGDAVAARLGDFGGKWPPEPYFAPAARSVFPLWELGAW